jgi:hypothetical protein
LPPAPVTITAFWLFMAIDLLMVPVLDDAAHC